MYVCMYVCMYACMYVCIIHIHIYIYICIYIHMYSFDTIHQFVPLFVVCPYKDVVCIYIERRTHYVCIHIICVYTCFT